MTKTIKQIIRAVDNWDSDEAADYELEEFKELELIESSKDPKYTDSEYGRREYRIYKHIPTNKFYKFEVSFSAWKGYTTTEFLGEVKPIEEIKIKWIFKKKENNV
jgi:hypothetical protein